VSLLRFDAQAANILAFISATLLILNSTPRSLLFVDTVRDTIAERMADSAGFGWHLDQAALAVAHLFHRNLSYGLIPPTILDSTADLHGVIRPPSEMALLWSITATFPQNMAKLTSPAFLQALVPAASRDGQTIGREAKGASDGGDQPKTVRPQRY
jgi:hypothetical protein